MGVQIVYTNVSNGVVVLLMRNVFSRVSFVDAGVGDLQINGEFIQMRKVYVKNNETRETQYLEYSRLSDFQINFLPSNSILP